MLVNEGEPRTANNDAAKRHKHVSRRMRFTASILRETHVRLHMQFKTCLSAFNAMIPSIYAPKPYRAT